jgi:hypothetical protein
LRSQEVISRARLASDSVLTARSVISSFVAHKDYDKIDVKQVQHGG